MIKKMWDFVFGRAREPSMFVIIGGLSTIVNYGLFALLFTLVGVHYLFAAGVGYVSGVMFSYAFNTKYTFRKKIGKTVFTYFLSYGVTLVMSLSLLMFLKVSLGIDPLIGNILTIGCITFVNFASCKFLVFNEKLKVPKIFKSRIFLSVLGLKIIASFVFTSDVIMTLFIPFVTSFVSNPLANPYSEFAVINSKAFPYPPFMLAVFSLPYVFFGLAAVKSMTITIFLIKLPLLLADIGVFYILYKLFENKEKYITYLYWCSPIIFYVNYIHGQLDIVPIALLLASMYFLTKNKFSRSAIFLGLSIATKSNVFVVIPIIFLYLLKKRKGVLDSIDIAKYFLISLGIYAVFVLAFLSPGFIKMVFLAPDQARFLYLGVNFPEGLVFYVIPALYLYLIFKTWSFKRVTKDILFMVTGVTFTLLVTLLYPLQGWYVWCIPFIVYFFIKEKKLDPWIYISFNAAYLLYFALIPASDIFNVFQRISPAIASMPTPYVILQSYGINAVLVQGLAFTALTSALLYTGYKIYVYGVKNSLIFQEKNGIPAIGICGDSGTGKTLLAEDISNFFGVDNTTVVHGDDIHKWERHDENWKKYTHLNPISNKIRFNYEQMNALKQGVEVQRASYDHDTGSFTEGHAVLPKNLLISEGLHTFFLNDENQVYELKIYLKPDETIRRKWKVERDTKKRAHSKKNVLAQLKAREQDAAKYITPQEEKADVIISYKKDGVEVDVRTDIQMDVFIERIRDIRSLSCELEYPNDKFLRMRLGGEIRRGDVEKLIEGFEVEQDDYEIDRQKIKDGYDGLMQALVLYLLNEKLRKLVGKDSNGRNI
ncbi:MAG: GtrA family protein [archaeon]